MALETILETYGNPSSGSLKDFLAEAQAAYKELVYVELHRVNL